MRKTILLLCAILVTLQASAQEPATGFPPYGSFENGRFDAVNRQNLNVNFAIPIVSSPGRGTDFNFAVTYDSLIWKKVTTGSTTSWSPVSGWGWKKDATFGSFPYQSSTVTIKCFSWPGFDWGTRIDYSNYAYIDPAGTRHPFNLGVVEICDEPPTGTTTAFATDGSGYFLDASTPTNPFVLSPGGTKIKSGAGLTDPNGNRINVSGGTSTEVDWKDAAGRVTLKIIKPNTTTIEYHVLNPTGGYSVTTLALAPFIIATNFACSGVVEYTGTVNLPTSIVLPNGRSYTFTYEATSDPTTDTTGRLSKVTLPTGGSYEYAYTGANGGMNCDDGTAVQLTRTIDDGIPPPSSDWQFSRTQIDSTTWKTVVTNPEANESVFTFTNGRLTSQKLYQGTEGGTPLRTINTTWAANGTPASTTVILEDGSTQSMTETTFDSFGNLTEIKEYDWGSSTPTRTTQMTYESATAYTDRNIRNLLKQRIVREGDVTGLIKDQTDITYDDTTLTCVTGAVQHDDTGYGCAFTVRGNPTSITRGGITRFFTYDSLGNLRQADLDCCQQKEWNYSPTTQYAYPDSITSGPASGPQLTQGFVYNLDTGLVTSFKDENDKTTTFAYDNLGRLITVSRPDDVQTTTTYHDVNRTVTVETPIQGTDKVRQKTFFDQLGRPFKQCTQDASGTDISCTETEYDELSRGYRVSNPFTGSASNWTETHFDALGRQTTVIAQDGNSSSFTYAANMVTVTDPTGKQRRSVTDALGRLIQVDEPGGSAGTETTASGGWVLVSGSLAPVQGQLLQAATYSTASVNLSGAVRSIENSPEQPAASGTGWASVAGSLQSKQVQTAAATAGTGSVTVSGSEQSTQVQTQAATAGTGSVTINGSEQSTQVETQAATAGTGSVTITGAVQSTVVNLCDWPEKCFTTIYDSGTVSITVNGLTKSVTYVQGSTANTIASALRSAINGDSGYPVTAAGTGGTVTLTAKQNGTATNYSLSAGSFYNTTYFSQPSFTATRSGSTLTGGQDAQSQTVYDSGTVWVKVNTFTATASYGQGSTASSIASSLRSILNGASSPVTAGGTGTTITLTSKTTGASTNYSLTVGRTYDTSNFSSPSFTASRSGSTLTGGADAQFTTVYDSGTVWAKVGSFTATASFSQGSTTSSIATSLRSILNGGSSPVTAGGTGTTITLTSKTTGASSNYSLTVGRTYDTSNFSSPSFTASRSGTTLTGGADAQFTTVYDSGTVKVTVDGFTATASFGQGSTTSSIATSLRSILNGGSSPVTASGTGATADLTANATGVITNYPLSVSWTYDTSEFPSASFTATKSGDNLTGGRDYEPAGMLYDSGNVTITISGAVATASYGQGSTAQSIALALRDTINASPGTYLVQAVASEVSTSPPEWSIDLTALTTGNLTYSLSAQTTTVFPSEFSSPPSFTVVSDSSVTGGQDAVYEQLYDSGTVSVTVGNFTVNVPYNQTSNSTASEIAAVLRAGFAVPSSPVISGGTGTQVDFTSEQPGLGGNYAVTVSSVSNDPAHFTPPSFTGTSANLSGGVDEQLTMATAAVTTYTYDVLDNLKQVAQGAQTRTYDYDSLSRLTSVKTPETNNVATSFTYNNFSQVLTRTDPRGVVKTFSYDGLNRLTQVTYSDGTPAVSFAYGTNATSNNKGRLITVTYNGSSNTESFTYDMLGRVTQATKKIDNVNYPVSYAYNLASELSSITYPSGRVVQQSYDGIGRLSTIASGGTTYASGFAYNTAQQVTGFNYDNGVAASFGYSAQRLQLTSLSYAKDTTKLLDLAYSYAANGQISRITDNTGTEEAGRTVDYSYDPLGRLQTAVTVGSASYAQWGLAWSYDRYGNRTAQNVTAGSATAPQLAISATTNRITSAGYSYDAAGNMTNDAVNAYTYDAENRIKTVNGSTKYQYDGASLRIKKYTGTNTLCTNSGTTCYIYSGTKVIAEYVSGSLSKEYIYSGSGLLATLDSGGTPTYHHAEHLSARVNTNSSGTTVGQQGHYPFGESWYSSSTTTKWSFTTYERDGESSLDYAMFRYDNSRLGRFMTPDPLAGSPTNPQSLNRYAYVLNDPTNLVDPLGLAPLCRTVTRIKVTSATFIFGDEGSPIGVRFGKTELVEECVPLSGPGLQELFDKAKELQENRKKEGEEQLGQMGPKIGAFTDCVTNAVGSFNRKSGLAVVKFTPKTLSPSLPRTFLFTTPGGGLQAIGAVLFGLSLLPSPDAPLTLPERVIIGALGAGIFSLGTFVNDRALNSELKSLESALGKDVNKCSTLLQ